MEKIKAFEDSISTVWLPEQIAEITGQQQKIAEAIKAESKPAKKAKAAASKAKKKNAKK